MRAQFQPLTRTCQGHIDRVGKDMYLAVLHDNKRNHYELMELDPYAAQTAAKEFCARNNMSLTNCPVTPEVKQAHLDDIGAFIAQHEGERVKPEYMPKIRLAV